MREIPLYLECDEFAEKESLKEEPENFKNNKEIFVVLQSLCPQTTESKAQHNFMLLKIGKERSRDPELLAQRNLNTGESLEEDNILNLSLNWKDNYLEISGVTESSNLLFRIMAMPFITRGSVRTELSFLKIRSESILGFCVDKVEKESGKSCYIVLLKGGLISKISFID